MLDFGMAIALGSLSLSSSLQTDASDNLDATILADIMPSIGEKCKMTSELFFEEISTHTFNHRPSPSKWDPVASTYEKELFLAEMSNKNVEKADKSWTLRVGQAGNIYSFRGASYGEAIPPQHHPQGGGQWIDEVMQTIAVDVAKNKIPESPYFIHQAGIYAKDDNYTQNHPFFSPNIVKHCSTSASTKECLFGSWGQQAHVPTFLESHLLYFNSYRDCGDGVIEFTTVIHNSDDDFINGDVVDYLNVPWGGVRHTALNDLYLSKPSEKMEIQWPIGRWGETKMLDLSETGGFTTFAEQMVVSDELSPRNLNLNRMIHKSSYPLASSLKLYRKYSVKPIEEDKRMSLTFVHGTQKDKLSQRYATSRIRYGIAGNAQRDYSAFSITPRIKVSPGDTYVYRQYIITGKLSGVEETAPSWIPEVFEDIYPLGEMTNGRWIFLFSTDSDTFGVFLLDDKNTCSKGVSRCVGKSIPEPGRKPLFAITCGDQHYVGFDPYFFSPPRVNDKDTIRSYVCQGQDMSLRPHWKLLGFFEEGSCEFLKAAKYNEHFCFS